MARSALIVDDSASMRQLVHQTLKSIGFVVTEAEHGRDALAKLKARGIVDLVVTDLNMPVMDGLALVQELRALAAFKYTPVLMLTTETRDDYKAKAKSAGATGWLVKPFEPKQLIAVVQRVLP
jgi:two-component system, chemotaxis family, chemotaxis protein CheY